MQSGIGFGELIIGEGAVRDDGLTQKYVPGIYPAVPSFKLMALAHKYAPDAVYGIIRSHDGFYMDDNAENEAFWSKKGIVGADMESGALMTIGPPAGDGDPVDLKQRRPLRRGPGGRGQRPSQRG